MQYFLNMLTAREREGIHKIVGLLSTQDVASLVKTVTNDLITAVSRPEAENVIVNFTQSPVDFLKRRKVTRETLCRYLYSENVAVNPDAAKHEIIQECLKFWGSEKLVIEIEEEEQSTPISSTSSNDQLSEFGKQFVKWYYLQVNGAGDPYGPQHFFENSRLELLYNEGQQVMHETCVGSQDTAKRLWDIAGGGQRVMMVNDTSVTCQQESHGLMCVFASGTVHELESFVGTFDQAFGLIKKPFKDIWNIQNTKLKLTLSRPINLSQKCLTNTCPSVGSKRDA